ncbi:hypothetical protein V5O48_014867 [Marasmius crinis-equi]|uniref:Cytochrome P450 n=1 Tax=Marasmius crinis-equi TaxID=585013 RepID=A0ABR3EW35_9AGAR
MFFSILTATVFYLLYRIRQSRRVSSADLPGPKASSFLRASGNFYVLKQELYVNQLNARWQVTRTVIQLDFKWQSEFGGVVRFSAPLGAERLLISDPKAINHILQGYRWGQSAEQVARTQFLLGPSIIGAQGENHKRHRRIMNPAFGLSEVKALVPVFSVAASALTNKWKDLLLESVDQSEVFNVPKWASRATLDAIGHAGFEYNFGAMEDQDNRLAVAYNNLLQVSIPRHTLFNDTENPFGSHSADLFAAPSDKRLIMTTLFTSLMPVRFMSWVIEYMSKSNPKLGHARVVRETAREVASEVVAEKLKEIGSGQGDRLKDVMSLLVKANMNPQNEKSRLSDEELLAQMLAIFIAGHETTANALSWTLLELSKRPEIQEKLREEIRHKEREIAAEERPETGFTAENLESLPYLNAVVKESLRYHPVVVRLQKAALMDDCLPLSESIKMKHGGEINELPVPKGTKVMISVAAYNRSEAIFGEDAHDFRPERWLEQNESGLNRKKGASTAGVYSNLMTFSVGARSCIGWRFAVFELQAFLVELIRNFEFSLTPECARIRREAAGAMLPTLEGQVEKGNLGEFLRAEAGELDFKWHSEFGGVVRIAAPLGEEQLLISDPKAINHIIQGYRWGRSAEERARELFLLGEELLNYLSSCIRSPPIPPIVGPGITAVNGEDHKRQRKIMTPAFGHSEVKALVPVFSAAASSLTNKWKDKLLDSKEQSEVFNVHEWASRATLDAIGHAGFDYNFGAMENQDNPLASAYHNLLRVTIMPIVPLMLTIPSTKQH